MRVVVIGMGKMGIVHSCVLSVVPGVEVVALCEKSPMIKCARPTILTLQSAIF